MGHYIILLLLCILKLSIIKSLGIFPRKKVGRAGTRGWGRTVKACTRTADGKQATARLRAEHSREYTCRPHNCPPSVCNLPGRKMARDHFLSSQHSWKRRESPLFRLWANHTDLITHQPRKGCCQTARETQDESPRPGQSDSWRAVVRHTAAASEACPGSFSRVPAPSEKKNEGITKLIPGHSKVTTFINHN